MTKNIANNSRGARHAERIKQECETRRVRRTARQDKRRFLAWN